MRARPRAWLGLVLLFAVVSGGVSFGVAGARRTASAYPRFVEALRAPEALVGGPCEPECGRIFDAVRALPEVEDAALAAYFNYPTGATDRGVELATSDFVEGSNLVPIADAGGLGTSVLRFKVLRGHLPAAIDEAAVSLASARATGLDVGETFHLQFEGREDERGPLPPSPVLTFRVTAVVVAPGSLDALTVRAVPRAFLTKAFYDRYIHGLTGTPTIAAGTGLVVRLRGGVSALPALNDKLQDSALVPRVCEECAMEATDLYTRDLAPIIAKDTGTMATALWLMALALGLAGAALCGQVLSRLLSLEREELRLWSALGMTRRAMIAAGVARGALAGLTGSAAGLLGAWLCSPLTPIGVARLAEPHPGLRFEPLTLAVLGGSTALGALLAVLPGARTAARRNEKVATQPGVIAEAAARAPLPVSAATGIRLALDTGRGVTSVPVRASLAAIAIGVASLTVALGVGSSLRLAAHDPSLSGRTWDETFGWSCDAAPGCDPRTQDDGSLQPSLEQRKAVFLSDPGIADVAVGQTFGEIALGSPSNRIPALTLEPVRGTIGFTVIEGRAPRAADEILIGSALMRNEGARVGGTLTVTPPTDDRTPPPVDFRVVGRGVIPNVGEFGSLGDGVAITPGAWALLGRGDAQHPEGTDMTFVRFAPGADRDAVRARLRAQGYVNPEAQKLPADLARIEQAARVPLLVAGVLALAGAATLAHVLLTAVRLRRRDLAILRTVGFTPGQVARAVGWQAATITILGATAGAIAGIVIANWGYRLIALRIDVVPSVVLPIREVLAALLPAAIALAWLLSLLPGHSAGRIKPSIALRAE